MTDGIGKTLVQFGLGVAALGALIWLLSPWLKLGRLPGDIAIQREGFSIYIPIVTGLVLSLIVTVILWVVRSLRS